MIETGEDEIRAYRRARRPCVYRAMTFTEAAAKPPPPSPPAQATLPPRAAFAPCRPANAGRSNTTARSAWRNGARSILGQPGAPGAGSSPKPQHFGRVGCGDLALSNKCAVFQPTTVGCLGKKISVFAIAKNRVHHQRLVAVAFAANFINRDHFFRRHRLSPFSSIRPSRLDDQYMRPFCLQCKRVDRIAHV